MVRRKHFFKIELAAVIFVKATYNLEGDGPVVLQTYDHIQVLKAKIENPHYPNVDAVAKSVAAQDRTHQQLKQHASKCVQPIRLF